MAGDIFEPGATPAVTCLADHGDDSPPRLRARVQHAQRFFDRIQCARARVAGPQHPHGMRQQIGVAREILPHCNGAVEREHRGLARASSKQARQQDACAPELVNNRSCIRTGLDGHHERDGRDVPVELYLLGHIVVIKNQIGRGEPIDVMAFRIGDRRGSKYQRSSGLELRNARGGEDEDAQKQAHFRS